MPSLSTRTLFASISLSLVVLGLAVSARPDTTNAQRGRGASVFITQARIPGGLSERGLLGFVRGHQARFMNESTDQEIADRKWLGNMIVNFRRPPNDLEFHAIFYDVTSGARNFLDDMTVMIGDRNQTTYVQRIRLERPRFQPEKRYEVVITVRRAEMGSTRFETRGERVHHSGQVDFSVEDTRGN